MNDTLTSTKQTFGQELHQLIIGDISPAFYTAGLFFAALGAFLYKAYRVRNRNKNSTHSPRPFSPLYFIKYNGFNLLLTAMTILAMIRFYPDIVKNFKPDFVKTWGAADMFMLFLLGVFFDVVIEWVLWRITKGKYQILSQVNKTVMFQVGSTKDAVESINAVPYNGISVEELVNNYPEFSLDYYDNQTVLCTQIAKTIPLIKGNFIAEKGTPYTLKSINQ